MRKKKTPRGRLQRKVRECIAPGPGVYKVTNQVNGKVYVGGSSQLPTRCGQHVWCLMEGKHRSKVMQHDYDNGCKGHFIFKVLERCSRQDLVSRETHWIHKLGSLDPDKGYNRALPSQDSYREPRVSKLVPPNPRDR